MSIFLVSVMVVALPYKMSSDSPSDKLDLQQAIQIVRNVGPGGKGSAAAARAWKELAKIDPGRLPEVLAGMDGASPLARNWLRTAIDQILAHGQDRTPGLPQQDLEKFLRDRQHDSQARRLAYELLLERDKTIAERFLPGMLDDPSPALRHDAVDRVLRQAEKLVESGKKADAIGLFQQAFTSAREKEQIASAVRQLRALGEKIDVATHLGLVLDWKLAGPFPNAQQKGINTAFPPEQKLDWTAEYDGKVGKVRWTDYVSKDDYGLVDLNKGVGKHMEAVAYAATEFTSKQDQDVELRIGCFTAFKAWVNGELGLVRGDAYTGMSLDHYRAKVHLRAGKNVILLKLAQDFSAAAANSPLAIPIEGL